MYIYTFCFALVFLKFVRFIILDYIIYIHQSSKKKSLFWEVSSRLAGLLTAKHLGMGVEGT